ncbi:MAG TPA: sulfite exporter TauE/SafE family protein [Phenylobacterium sp.]|jgi:hypothetical protein
MAMDLHLAFQANPASGLVLLAAAGLVAGTLNAFAGGGSFITLPALIAVGLPAVAANASSTLAVLPGSVASAWVHRREVVSVGPVGLISILAVSVAGGLVGGVLLLVTPSRLFDRIVPWLMLAASLALWTGPRLRQALQRTDRRLGAAPLLAGQGLLGVYGGYYGGGVGIMAMAFWGLASDQDLKTLTPVRILTSVAMNAAAVAYFIAMGAIRWPQTMAVLAGAVAGGYVGAVWGRRLSAKVIRAVVLAVATITTIAFFLRAA